MRTLDHSRRGGVAESVELSVGETTLPGDLEIPSDAAGLVIFAHGSGSSRLSPRNRAVAEALRKQGSATLLFDLLTSGEEAEDAATGHLRFDVDLLAHRLIEVAKWAGTFPLTCNLPVGFFGASTGGAAALMAAAALPSTGAVVIRGGRPDLAAKALPSVRAATLLIVGEYDRDVLALNQEAFASLQCDKELVIVPRASHLFSERGALSEVSALAAMWFKHAWESAGSAPAQRRFGPDT